MRLAVWDEPALDFFARGVEALSEQRNLQLTRANRRASRDLLILGNVDVALVPAMSVFTDTELFDVLPAVAISTWDFPFLKLHLKKTLGAQVASVAIDPFYAQEAIVARIILKEHYDSSPSFHPVAEGSPDVLMRAQEDAALVMSPEVLTSETAFDVGRDWFELTHYPMVWGLFVTRKGEAESQWVNLLREIAHFTEVFKNRWLEESPVDPALAGFFSEGIRYRLDDMAIASLTVFQDYLYFNNVVEEIEPLVFYQVDDVQDDDEEQPLL